jgi:hypothetical protein
MPFGIWNRKVRVTVDRQKQVDVGYARKRLEQGDLSLVTGIEGGVVLNDAFLLEPRTVHRTVGGMKGRIARGLYFYTPQPQSTEPVEELAEVDRGTMTINNDGVAFSGKTRRIGVGFGAVESIGHGRDWIAIHAKNSNRLHFGVGEDTITLKVQDRIYREPLSGTLLRLLVEGVMKASLERRH